MKPYQPKRKTYHSLTQLKEEMLSEGIKIISFDGASIQIKGYSYGMYDSTINIRNSKGEPIE